jgi:hypothetical protein
MSFGGCSFGADTKLQAPFFVNAPMGAADAAWALAAATAAMQAVAARARPILVLICRKGILKAP